MKVYIFDTNAYRNLAKKLIPLSEEDQNSKILELKTALEANDFVIRNNYFVIAELLYHLDEDESTNTYKECSLGIKLLFEISNQVEVSDWLESRMYKRTSNEKYLQYDDGNLAIVELAEQGINNSQSESFLRNLTIFKNRFDSYKKELFVDFQNKIKEIRKNIREEKLTFEPIDDELFIENLRSYFLRDFYSSEEEYLQDLPWLIEEFSIGIFRRGQIFQNAINPGSSSFSDDFSNNFIDMLICDDFALNSDDVLVTDDGKSKASGFKSAFNKLNIGERCKTIDEFIKSLSITL